MQSSRSRWRIALLLALALAPRALSQDDPSLGAGRVSGCVVDLESGAPVAGARVSIASGSSSDERDSTTGANGAFVFKGLRPAKYRLKVRHDTLVATAEPPELVVAPGETHEVAVTMVPGGVITGRVTDRDSRDGIEGVTVGMSTGDFRKAQTDASGCYRITGRTAGVHRVSVDPIDGYRRVEHSAQTVTASLGETIGGVDFVLERRTGILVRAVVVDEAGHPVPMSRVDAKSAHHQHWSYTKDDGSYTYRHEWPTRSLVLQATRDHRASAPCGPLTVEPGRPQAVTLRLEPGATIRGRVVDQQGIPLRRSDFKWVKALPEDDAQPSRGTPSQSPNGQFTIAGLPPGAYTITTGESAVKTAQVTLAPGERIDDLVLVHAIPHERLSISGRVVDDLGHPVPGATIMVDGEGGRIRSDAGGRFRVKNLAAGVHKLSTDHPHYRPSAKEEVSAGDEGVLLTATRRAVVEGQVVRADNGLPVTTYDVKVANYPVDALDRYALDGLERVHAPEGRLSLKGVGPGEATIIVRAPGLMPTALVMSYMIPGEICSGVVVRLAAEARVAGRAVDETGEPVAGALLFRKSLPLEDFERSSVVPPSRSEHETLALAKTDGNGRFEFGGLPEAAQLVAAYHPDFEASSQEIVPQPGRTVTVDFVLKSGGTIAGTITHDGRPLNGIGVLASVDVSLADEKPAPGQKFDVGHRLRVCRQAQRYARTDVRGHYVIKGLPSGNASVSATLLFDAPPALPEGWPPWQDADLARRDNVLSRRRQVAAQVKAGWTTEVDIDFPGAGAVIEGAIHIAGQPAGRAELMITGSLPDGTRETFLGMRLTQGAYRVSGIPAGEWQVRVTNVQPSSLDSYHQIEQAPTVSVEAGETAVVDFDLPEE